MFLHVLVFIFFLLVSIIVIYRKVFKPVKYWQERDVVHTKAWPLVGSMKDFVMKKKHITEIFMDIYKQHPNERCVGYMQFLSPFLMIKDLELINKITVKDFDYFRDHLVVENMQNDRVLSKILISLNGESWKQMRATLSQVFTSNKLKIMYPLISECCENFTKHFENKEQQKIEMKDIFSRFANDVIATTAFGVQIDSLEDPNNDFYRIGGNFTSFSLSTTFKVFIMQFVPGLAKLLGVQLFSSDVTLFFRSLIKDNIKRRENEEIRRPDLINLLLEARKQNSIDEDGKSSQMELTDNHIVAQALSFFFSGFDTISTGACFIAHELAVHPEIQKQLQLEVDSVNKKCRGKVTYEALLSMNYLDQVISEVLRLWPPSFQTDRLCVKNYVIEPQNPKERVVFVEKGTSIMIPIMAIHRNPEYFTDPNKFDPERFNDDNKGKIIPGTYLPFGVGPRSCIGSGLALLELKILFFQLLSKYILIPVDETEIPLKISPKKFNMAPEKGFWLGLKPRLMKSN